MMKHPVYQRMGISEIIRQNTMKKKAELNEKQKKEIQDEPAVSVKKEE